MSKSLTGRLDRIITIQKKSTNEEDNGYLDGEWYDFTKTWAGMRGLSGREYYAAAAIQSETDVVLNVRYDSMTSQITSEMRIIEGTDTENPYNIKSVIDKDGSKKWLEIRANR